MVIKKTGLEDFYDNYEDTNYCFIKCFSERDDDFHITPESNNIFCWDFKRIIIKMPNGTYKKIKKRRTLFY